jgi:hypothetical protein
MDRVVRGRGALSQGLGPTLEISRATVQLDRGREGRIVLEARRERVTIEGRWLEASGEVGGTAGSEAEGDGRVQFEIRRINQRVASGRLTIRRERGSFSTIDGDGQTESGRFLLVFVAQ